MNTHEQKAYRIALCTDIIVTHKNTLNLRKYYEEALTNDDSIKKLPTEPTIINDMREAREGLARKVYDPQQEAITAVEIVKETLSRALSGNDKYAVLKCIELLDKWFDFGSNIPKNKQSISNDKLKEYLS